MKDPLNRYFSHQLFFFSAINLKKFEEVKNDPKKQSWLSYAYKEFQERSVYLKEQLAKHSDDVAEIRQALINHLTQQYAVFRTANYSEIKRNHLDSDTPFNGYDSIVDQVNGIYWAAVICACTRGEVSAPQPVSHLNKITNTLFRRIIVLAINKLKREKFITQLDLVEFLTTYVSFDDSAKQRWTKLFRRAILPVWMK